MHQGQAFLGLLQGEGPVVGVQISPGSLIAPPTLAVGIAHGRVRLGGVILLRQEVVGHEHRRLRRVLADNHRLPAVILVEFHHGAVPRRIGHHVMVTGADGRIVPHVHGLQQRKGLADRRTAVQPEAHQDGRPDLVLSALLLRSLLGQGHDGGAEAFLIDPVDRRVDGGEATQRGDEIRRDLFQGIAEMGHVAHRERGVPLLRVRESHHRGVLEIVIVAAVPEAVPVRLRGLETRAVHGGQFPVRVGDLGTLHLDGNALPDAADHVIQQRCVGVDVLGQQLIQVIGGLVFHLIQIGIPAHRGDGTEGLDLTAPDDGYGDAEGDQDQEDGAEEFLHGRVMGCSGAESGLSSGRDLM